VANIEWQKYLWNWLFSVHNVPMKTASSRAPSSLLLGSQEPEDACQRLRRWHDGTIRCGISCVDSHSPLSAHINPSFAEIGTRRLLYHQRQFHLCHRMSLVGGGEKDHGDLCLDGMGSGGCCPGG
jgi:hypothetical protein